MDTPTTYSFGRRGGGIMMGLDGPALILAAILLGIVMLALLLGGLLPAALILVLGAGLLWAPTPSGVPLRDVLRRLARWSYRAITGTTTTTPSTGFTDDGAATTSPPWGDVTITAAQDGRAVVDLGHGEFCGVWGLAGGQDFALRSIDDQELALSRWGSALDQLAGTPTLRRIQWLSITSPDRAAEPASWLAAHATAPPQSPALLDYATLLDQLGGGAASRRDVLLVAVVAPRRSDPASAAAELRSLDARLGAGELAPTPVGAGELAALLSESADPSQAPLDQLAAIRGLPPAPAVAMWARDDPDCLVVQGNFHATLTVMELPRMASPADWLWPLLSSQVPSATRMAVSCHMAPLSQWRAMRAAESAVTSAESEMRRRSKAGFSTRSRDLLALQGQANREQEVAAGHSTYRIGLSVTISATTREALRQATDDALAAIRRARCEAHPALAAHRAGWLASLPLGLPSGGETFTVARAVRSLHPCEATARSQGGGGVALGMDALAGSAWSFDPWAGYAAGLLTNPNIAVFGRVGRGKSSFVKALILRSVGVFGRRCWILDPKGEYTPLGQALGLPVLTLRPGGDVRVNPLDVPPGTSTDAATTMRANLLRSLLTSVLHRPLVIEEQAGVTEACRQLGPSPVLADVVELMLHPTEAQAAVLATTADRHADAIREAALALQTLTCGQLAGMFDGPSTVQLTGAGGIIDLSAAYSSNDSLPPVLSAATSWITTAVVGGGGVPTYIVVDEAWQVLGGGVDFLRASAKLSRSLGISLVLLMHHLADLGAAGDEGSATARRAEGLFADVETVAMFGDQLDPDHPAAQALGLSDRECELVTQLDRGRCLVASGGRHHLVDVVLTATEQNLTDTDAAMRAAIQPTAAATRP
ncbi:MAG: SCO6880 family protein [Acidimicrobiales bacterium]